jgi:malonyl-CoA O-methyltransferase
VPAHHWRQISQVPGHALEQALPSLRHAAMGDASRAGIMVSIYWLAMVKTPPALAAPVQPGTQRPLDPRALARVVARLNGAALAPWLHGEVARRMAERLAIIRLKPARVFDWGAFVGGSAASLAAACHGARIVAVEPDLARQRAGAGPAPQPWWSPARWAGPPPQALAPADVPAGSAQLLWSNMHLHAVADPQALMAGWHVALQTEGFLMFSTLGPGSLMPLRAAYGRQGWPAPFVSFVDMHDLGDMLVHAGFADPVMDQETVTLTWSDGQACIDELRTLGGNVAQGRHAGLRTPRWRALLAERLQSDCLQSGRVALPFEIVYGHAFKPVPRHRLAAQTTIAVADLRTMARSPRRPA